MSAPVFATPLADRGDRLQTLMSMPCGDVGVGATCRSILRAVTINDGRARLFTSRSDSTRIEPFPIRTYTPAVLSWLPHRITRQISVRRLHRAYLATIGAGDIAYLWPSVPLHIFQTLHDRGVTIVTEAINTRMADARLVMDGAYAELGLPPTHRITPDRIADEEARLRLATAIFSPSPATDKSLARSAVADRVIPASYGTWVGEAPRRPHRDPGEPVTFLFIGRSCIRKGLHHLLEAWREAPPNARLRIVGLEQPELQRLYADVLAQPNVSATGFCADVHAEYARADVFILPSLEEGDPIVTYEAAAAGLPVLASATGAGRIGAETGAIRIFDTSDIGALRHEIAAFAASAGLRAAWGARALAGVAPYDWPLVAARRSAALSAFLKDRA
ncbi:MAG: glycosyltransferase family 4 protein [Proteobacteria bacterium]|nr:glycosyltransferase family 4 protein [Pseudomonadota bacterium]